MSNQLDGLEPEDIIKKVTGKITKLFPEKQHEGNYGPYTIQNGEIEVDGKPYKLTFWNNTQPESAKGRKVTLSSTRGKHGLNGVTFEEESYKNKKGQQIHNQVIKATLSAKVEYDSASEEPMRIVSVGSGYGGAMSATSKSIVTDNPEQELDKIVELHQYIDSLVRMAYLGKITDEETLRSYVSSVFIEANRKGIHYSTKVEAPKKEEPVKEELDPEDWGSVIVPSGSQKGKKLAEIGKPALIKLYEYYLEKGFTTPFAKCVEQAAEDLSISGPINPGNLHSYKGANMSIDEEYSELHDAAEIPDIPF
jgi:hypothetical protein